MEKKPNRRQFLGGTAAALTGAAALSGEAAAHSDNDPVFAPNTTWVREGPGLGYNVIREVEPETGMQIVDGPYSADGYTWWKYRVNGDSTNYSKIEGYEIEGVTNHADFIYPTYGEITSTYWDCRPLGSCDRYHRAIDIANYRWTDIGAGRGGTVSFAGDSGSGYGNLVIIDHGSGFETYYAHLEDWTTYAGATVSTGEHIGYMGDSGTGTGVHLHYEIRKDGYKQNWDMDDGAKVWIKTGIERNWSSISPTYL